MGLFGTLGSVGGGIIGSAFGPVGGIIGGAAGGLLGSALDPEMVGSGLSAGERARADQIRQQQALLADQLKAQAAGNGPNPAAIQAQRAGNTAIHQNQGFIASQKGMNPALAQRLAAQNQAMMGQEIAGKSSEISAQQQLAAQGQLSNLLTNQAQQEVQNKQLANQLQMAEQQRNAGMFGGLLNAAGAATQSYLSNKGPTTSTASLPQWGSGGSTDVGYNADNFGSQSSSGSSPYSLGEGITVQGYASGGKVPEFSGPRYYGEQFTGPQQAMPDTTDEQFKQYLLKLKEQKLMKPDYKSDGGKVAGKEVVKGDSPSNDNVPAMLSAGEIVIPKSAASDPKMAKEFIDHIMKKEKGSDIGFEDIMAKQIEMQKKIAQLEKKLKG